jgi:hypothetical protein
MSKHQAILTCPITLQAFLLVWVFSLTRPSREDDRGSITLRDCLGIQTREEFYKEIYNLQPITQRSILDLLKRRGKISDWVYERTQAYVIQQEMEEL